MNPPFGTSRIGKTEIMQDIAVELSSQTRGEILREVCERSLRKG